MEIKAIKSNKTKLQYPTISYFVENPKLLAKSIPANWSRNVLLSGALAAFVLSGCSHKGIGIKNTNNTVLASYNKENRNKDKDTTKESKSEKTVSVAPIFAHGEGSGAIGCLSMSAPVFISEYEAKQIILDALNDEGIMMDTVNCPEVVYDFNEIVYPDSVINKSYGAKNLLKLKFDAFNKTNNLAIKYISSENCNYLFYENKAYAAEVFRTKNAADNLRKKMVKDQKYNSCIFYDPLIYYDENKSYEKAKKEAKKQLLKQVEDFIDWLKEQKILK